MVVEIKINKYKLNNILIVDFVKQKEYIGIT